MRTFLSPKWILLVNTAPLLLLLLLGYGEFNVIKTLLPPASGALWQQAGVGLAWLALAAAAYAAWAWRGGRELGPAYCLLTLALYCAALTWYTSQSDELVPRSIPRWLVPTDLLLYVWTFLMPTLAHALFALVVRLTPTARLVDVGTSFGLAFMVPVVCAVLGPGLASLWLGQWSDLASYAAYTSFVLATLSFLFFVVRAVYVLGLRKAEADGQLGLVWKVLICAVLPVAGLAVNSSLAGGLGANSGVFGNFSSPWFYGLALLNAALLCVPTGRLGRGARLALFLGRAALFGYTFYFFLVFLPWLPLALPAIVLIGTGFLLLAPLLLFVVHVRELSADYSWLRQFFPPRLVTAGLLAGLAALPLYLTAQYGHDRRVLHAALAYLYAPDYAQPYDLDAASLARTLATLREHKSFGGGGPFGFGSGQPYLSTYFNWLVLDNLMLSEDKLADIERVFLGPGPTPRYGQSGPLPPPTFSPAVRRRPPAAPGEPALTSVSTRSTYDPQQQAWTSWLDLSLANTDTARQAAEYRTTLTLPAGCSVSDYYLDMNGRREPGLLAEKKAAAWVYAQILSETAVRDPGLLTYRGPDEISLRVYPVVGRAERQTGLQLLHKEPLVLQLDGRTITLGDTATAAPPAAPVATADGAVVYVSGRAKKALPLVRRRPRYHFLLDASAGRTASPAAYQARIARHFPQAAASGAARFSLVNAYSRPVPAGTDWAAQLGRAPRAGGYYLAGALRQALFEARQHPDPAAYPVLVAVTDDLAAANLSESFAEFASAYPESELFYVLGPDNALAAHSLRHDSTQPLASAPAPAPVAVRAWPDAARPRAYLPDTDAPAVVLREPGAAPPAPAAAGKSWRTGLLLHGYEQWQTFHPAAADARRVPAIQASFRTGILTSLTAYLALENEAQKAALRRKQDQTLTANAALDTEEEAAEPNDGPTAVPIDEGAALLLLAGGLLAWWHLRRLRAGPVAFFNQERG